MANIKFKEWQCHDDRPGISQELSLKWLLAFSGNHSVLVEAEIDCVFPGSLSRFTDDEGTWTENLGLLQGTGGGSPQWYKIRYDTGCQLGYVATFDKYDDWGAFVFCADGDYNGYMVWWSDTAVGVSTLASGVETKLISLPNTLTGYAAVTVMVWPKRNDNIDVIDDVVVSVWFDGRLLVTYTMDYVTYGHYIGFAVYGTGPTRYNNLRVGQLHQIVDWSSVDPGEPTSAGISRVIGYEHIFMRSRYNGSVKAWRETGSTVDWAISAGRVLDSQEERSLVTPTHYRLVGALHEADVFRAGSLGHIFAVGQDPNALAEDETVAKAGRRHALEAEDAHGKTLIMAPNPVLEPEDVVTEASFTWRVSSIDFRASWRGNAPVLESNTRLRECL